ncbi:MAG: pyridoxal phosphate-dependent aminotransferase [Salinarimonadaceae bacterium]|nr:MAG: pyridoxal phosphate-dependent aminotransferase [Salinarimonadaceae bacterium]
MLGRRVLGIKLSPTIAMSERAARMREAGKDVISMAVGELDFDTPAHVVESADAAAKRGFTRYTAPDGAPFVKDAVREKFLRDNDLSFGREEIHVASGCKQVIHNAFAATLDPGDEVVIFTPSWVSYIDIVEFCGGTPVVVETRPEEGFLPDPAGLEAALTPRTKWVLLNSPNNPTGAVYPAALLARLADVVAAHPRAMVMSDEIYEHLVFDRAPRQSFMVAAPALRPRTLIVNGVSKTYAMTGWRVGFAAGPRWLIDAMACVQSQTAGSSNSPAQAAAATALTGDQSEIPRWRQVLERRRDLAMEILRRCGRLDVRAPGGAFYIYADVSRCIGAITPGGATLADDDAVAEYLLDAAHVATVAGSAFAFSPFVRLSFALDEGRIAAACERIVAALDALTGPDARDNRGASS